MECEHDKETVLVSDSSAILTADTPKTLNLLNSLTKKLKVYFTLDQATKSQMWSRGIALLFL